MPTRKISTLTELATTPADDDLIQIIDVSDTTFSSAGTNKKIEVSNLMAAAPQQDEFWVAHGGAYISGTASFYYLPCSGASQAEMTSVQWYSKLPIPSNCRLYDVAVFYQRGSTGRTINLTAYDFNETGQAQNLGSSTNGPLSATATGGDGLVFNFNTSDFDLTSDSQFGLGINLAGSSTTILGFCFTIRFLLT